MIKKYVYNILVLFFLQLAACGIFAASPAPAAGQHAMVTTTNHIATQVGLDILKNGGNAVDAAVAIGYTLAVVEPCCGNIGGGGFMLIHLANGQNTFINFREKAPLEIKQSLFLRNGKYDPRKIQQGYLSVGVPGTVMGLNYALKKYGTLPLKTILQPAIHLAENGFRLDQTNIELLKRKKNLFGQQTNVAAIFLKDGKPYKTGEHLKQSDLAKTLALIAQNGTQAFYKGPIAEQLVQASQKHGGVFTLRDFHDYTVQELKPITCSYRGYEVISSPPPSSGGITLCEMLNVLNAYPLGFLGFHSALSVHYIAEAMRYAYADRNQYLGDPDFVSMPIEKLLSPEYAAEIRSQIQRYRAGDSRKIGFTQEAAQEKPQTTSYAVIDPYGNAVEVTYTLNGYFGAGVIAGQTGFFLNNEMDDFSLHPDMPNMFGLIQGSNNAIGPGKRPLSSMTPTILLKDGKFAMTIGAAGGSTIITQVLQGILNVLDYGMNIQEAIDAPRFHMQWLPDVIFMEPFAFSMDTQQKLAMMGYRLQEGSPFHTRYWGASVAILKHSGRLYGAVDSRRPAGLPQGF